MQQSRLTRTAAAALVLPAAATFALAGGDRKQEVQVSGASGSQSDSAQVSSDQNRGRQSSQQQQQAPEGFVLIEERVVYLLGNEPQQHFLAAAQKLAGNDKKGAAAELRIAANYIDMQASRADQDKEHLSKASEKLNKLADKAQASDINSPDQLSKAFAKANLALAKHYQAKAESSIERDNYVMAGYDLENAANTFRQAMVWSDQQPKEEQVQVMQTASQVAISLQAERMSAADQGQSDQAQSDQQASEQRDSEQAKAEQKESGDRFGDQAQQASASSSDPRLGTTPAEAQNIAQHAREAAKALGEQIDQFAQASQSGGDEAQQASEKQSRQQD